MHDLKASPYSQDKLQDHRLKSVISQNRNCTERVTQRFKVLLSTLFIIASGLPFTASSQTVTTYQYDALGRVVEASADNGDMSTFEIDDANNITRAERTSSGNSNSPPTCSQVLRIAFTNSYSIDGRTDCTDPDGDTMNVVSATDPAGAAQTSVSGNTVIFSNLPVGTSESTVTDSDGNGGTDTHVFSIYYEGGSPF